MTTAIVLQARMTSHRLPGKVLARLDGQPLLVHCIRRLRAAQIGRVVVALPEGAEHDAVAELAQELEATCFRGDELDVLDRVTRAARSVEAQLVVRATADNPAVDPNSVCRVVDALRGGADYALDEGLPIGTTVEGLRCDALETACREAVEPYDREHVTPFVRQRADRFSIRSLTAPEGLRRPDLRFTVDTPADLSAMNRLLTATSASTRIVGLAELIETADRIAAADQATASGAIWTADVA